MASPIFKVPTSSPYPGLPKTAATGLLLHKVKQSFKPPKATKPTTIHGHPIIKAPVVVKAPKTVHTSPTSLVNARSSMY